MCDTYKKKFHFVLFLLFGLLCTAISFSVARETNDQRPIIYTIVIYTVLLVTSTRYRLYAPSWYKCFSIETLGFFTLAFVAFVSYIIYWVFLAIFIVNFHDKLSDNDVYLMLICSVVTAINDLFLFVSLTRGKNTGDNALEIRSNEWYADPLV